MHHGTPMSGVCGRDAAGWAVLRTQQRREALASRAVAARSIETYIPRLPSRRSPGQFVPLFPNYVFARTRFDSDDLLRIRAAPGVAYVLPREGSPVFLPDELVETIRCREREAEAAARHEGFSRGDLVRVTAGPFKWVEGLFDRRLSAPGRVRILLDFVHGSATVDIDALDLEAVGSARRHG